MTPLLETLADGLYHRGPELADVLGVSRAAINQQIQWARTQGITIESVRSKGYRMPGGAEWLNEGVLRRALCRTFPGMAVRAVQQIDSTNKALMNEAWEQSPERSVLLAEHQTQGRGRRGRPWISPWGHNLYFTVSQRFEEGLPSALSLRAGVGLAKVLASLGVKGIQIKWPNDLWVADHKCGGILVEVQGDVAGRCRALVGVGLNVQTPVSAGVNIDQPWADLRGVGLKPDVSRNQLASRCIRAVFQSFELEDANWLGQFSRLDALRDRKVQLSAVAGDTLGYARGIQSDGALIVATDQGEQIVRSGEVSVRAHS